MRRMLLLISLLLVTVAWSMAQQTSPPSSPSEQGTTPSQNMSQQSATQSGSTAKQSIMHGCLLAGNDHYYLEDASGRLWQLEGDNSSLKDYVDQQVAISVTPGSTSNQLQVSTVGLIGECHR